MMTLPYWLFVAQAATWQQAGPILDRWCNDCHRPGQVGPFDFTSYDGAAAYAPEIARYLMAGKMPPWRAKPGPAVWANSRRIPDRSIGVVLDWINQGAKAGGAAPIKARHPQWNLGAPDLVLSQPREHTVQGEKTVDIVSFTLSAEEVGTTAGARYLRAFDLRPSNRNLLHHAVLRVGKQALAAWCMTDSGVRLPAGTAWVLPKGAALTVELHYFKRTLRAAHDLTRVAFYFAKAKPAREAYLLEATKMDIRIPAGANLHREATVYAAPEDLRLHAILPVFQLLAHSVKMRPAGQADWTLWVEPYEHHLMSSYVFERPLGMAKGAKLELEAVYDNSAQNEYNPHKTLREVVFAENGLDETFRFWLTVSRPLGLR